MSDEGDEVISTHPEREKHMRETTTTRDEATPMNGGYEKVAPASVGCARDSARYVCINLRVSYN